MVRGIIYIGVGLFMAIGGITGTFTSRLFNSPTALAIFGFAMIGMGAFQIVRTRKKPPPGGPPPPAEPPPGTS